jgi:hypothetical protein
MAERRFGEIPGVREGDVFADRIALSEAGVHRPRQEGISGGATSGADSIVVSGGYPDDEDYRDRIIYTGHGGNDSNTGHQVADQELHRGDRGLAVSARSSAPLRLRSSPGLSLSLSGAERSTGPTVSSGGGTQPLGPLEMSVRCLWSENHKGPRRSGGRETIAGPRHEQCLHVVVTAPTTLFPGCQPDEVGAPHPSTALCCGRTDMLWFGPVPLAASRDPGPKFRRG